MIPRYQEQRKKNKMTASQVNTVVIPDWFTGFGDQSVVPRIEWCLFFVFTQDRQDSTDQIDQENDGENDKETSGLNQHEQWVISLFLPPPNKGTKMETSKEHSSSEDPISVKPPSGGKPKKSALCILFW